MKQILLFSFLSVSLCSVAQIPAGTRTFGGNVSFYTSKTDMLNTGSNNVNFSINPRVGKAVKDNVVQGVGFDYQLQKNKSTGQPTTVTHQVGVEVYKQKFLPLGNSFMAFGEGNIGAGYRWLKNVTKAASVSAGLGAGLAYKASNKTLFTVSFPNAVSAYVGYNEVKFNNGTGLTKATGYSAGLQSTVSLNSLQFGVLLLR